MASEVHNKGNATYISGSRECNRVVKTREPMHIGTKLFLKLDIYNLNTCPNVVQSVHSAKF